MKRKRSEKRKNHEAYQYTQTFPLGPWTTYMYFHDPIHLSFVLSRYKFVARMVADKERVLEVGCGDAIGTPIVAQFVKNLVAVDIDQRIIFSNKKRLNIPNITYEELDISMKAPAGKFDAAFSIDVIEHIEKKYERACMEHISRCLKPEGICIVGTPNITSTPYASKQSREYHVNMFSHERLRELLSGYFENVFIFAMNDEVVHTGFPQMAHYLFGMGVGVKHEAL